MTRKISHLRPSWIALVAIAGLLLVAGELMACESKGAPKFAQSCCASRPSSDCGGCCDSTGTPSKSEMIGRADAPVVAEAGLAVPQRSCECRSGEPTAPASKPESRPIQSRSDQDRDSDVAFTVRENISVSFAPLSPRPTGPPRAPLYLRISRLLI